MNEDAPAGPRPLTMTEAATIGTGLVGVSINMDPNPAVGGADLYQHLREVLWTSIPAMAITLVHFLPLVVVIVLSPLISIALAFLGVRMLKAPPATSSSGS